MPDGSAIQVDRKMRLAQVRKALAEYRSVGEEINRELQALGLEKLVYLEEFTNQGRKGWSGGLGRQLRAELLAYALDRVQA